MYEVKRTAFGSISRFYRAEPATQERRHAPFPDILRLVPFAFVIAMGLSGCAAASAGIGIAAGLSTLANNEFDCSLVHLQDCRIPTVRLPGMAVGAVRGVIDNVVTVDGRAYRVTFTPVSPSVIVPNESLDGR